MSARRVLLVLIALAAAVMIGGCESRLPDRSPDIRGEITSVDPPTGIPTTILVEGQIESDTEYDRASVEVNAPTDIKNADGSTGELTDLGEGLIVEVWFTGPVAESYPVQARAEAVNILQP